MEDNTVKIRFEIDLDLLGKLEDLAESSNQTLKATIVQALTEYVELYEDTGVESLDDHLEPYEVSNEIDENGEVIRIFPEDDGC
jgi:predicted transcriptional regulator